MGGTPETERASRDRLPDARHTGNQPAFRVLLAYDMSPAAERAAALIASTRWPGSTVVGLTTSPMGIGPLPSSFAGLREVRAHTRDVQHTIARAHEQVTSDLRAAGLTVETAIVHGRPERAILAAAKRFGADLVVVGARDQGGLSATLLGSVSRAVVGSAPCSVLVARATAVSRVVLATDGSPPARLAGKIVATWPLFADTRIVVVAVGEAPTRYPGLGVTDVRGTTTSSDTTFLATDDTNVIADETVRELAAAGRDVERETRLGEAAAEIVGAAESWAADLVVVGTHGGSLLRRLLLGTVAQRILDGVSSSVLVARDRQEFDATPAAPTPGPQ